MAKKTVTAWVGMLGKSPCVVGIGKKTTMWRLYEFFPDDVRYRLENAGRLNVVKAEITWEDK